MVGVISYGVAVSGELHPHRWWGLYSHERMQYRLPDDEALDPAPAIILWVSKLQMAPLPNDERLFAPRFHISPDVPIRGNVHPVPLRQVVLTEIAGSFPA